MRWRLALGALCLLPHAAWAELPAATLTAVDAVAPAHARFPLAITAFDISGHSVTLGEALAGHPGFIVFADFTCNMLCGPALVLLSAAIERESLPADSYRVAVIGLDPKDTSADATHMLDAEVPETLRSNTLFLRPNPQAIAALTGAVGYRYIYDPSTDQFAHAQLAYAVAPDGAVLKLLSPFALVSGDLRAALTSAPPSGVYGRIRTICYRLGLTDSPLSVAIETAVAVCTGLTLIGLLGAMRLMNRRRAS